MRVSQLVRWGKSSRVGSWLTSEKVGRPTAGGVGGGRRSSFLTSVLEIVVIGIWACWIGRAFLDFDPYTWPIGRELGYQIEGHFFWEQVKRCGLCALWDGGINGGAPALVDLFSPKLHPFVAVPTLIWGVSIGTKLSLVLSFWMAGVAQWWLARILKLSLVPRLWSAFLAVVGGHLLGRLWLGSPGLVLSTAASSLAWVAAIDLASTLERRSTILLGVFGALAVVSGHGYLQLGLLAWAPVLLLMMIGRWSMLRPLLKELGLAVLLSVLLTGIAIVPAVHFFPNFEKFTDPAFNSSQPLEYIPLNLVIRDHGFFRTEILGKLAFEELYTLYIGWVPILLAALSLRIASRANLPIILCLGVGALFIFFLASGTPLRWLVAVIPGLAGFRHSPLIAGMAVPPIIGLAALGLEGLLVLNWPDMNLRLNVGAASRAVGVNLAWVLLIPLAWSLQSAYDYGKEFLATVDVKRIYDAVSVLKAPSLEWVSTPFGEHYWVEPSVEEGLKLTSVVSVWWWTDRQIPPPTRIASRTQPPAVGAQTGSLEEGIPIYEAAEQPYAVVMTQESLLPCVASGTGGDLTVECSASEEGRLIVQENSWTGWRVYVDQKPARLEPGPLLSALTEPGSHVYGFVYRPWDAVVGILVTIAGIGLTLVLLLENRHRALRGASGP